MRVDVINLLVSHPPLPAASANDAWWIYRTIYQGLWDLSFFVYPPSPETKASSHRQFLELAV